MFDRVYATLILNNKQFEEEFGSCEELNNTSSDYSSLKRLYAQTKSGLAEPAFSKYLVLHFFRRVLINHSEVMKMRPKILVKYIFGLVQIHLEYPSFFTPDEIASILGDGRHQLASFDRHLVQQWLTVYVSEWEDAESVHSIVSSRFPLELFGCDHVDGFLNRYIHLVFDRCLTEFGKIPVKLTADPRWAFLKAK